jgi:hypothetical protein
MISHSRSLEMHFRLDFELAVANPDHPFLLEGPDILAANEGRLLCVFAPSKMEKVLPEKLISRLVLSRIALPAHAAFALSSDDGLASSIVSHFDAIVDIKKIKELKSFLNSYKPKPSTVQYLMHYKKKAFRDSSIIQSAKQTLELVSPEHDHTILNYLRRHNRNDYKNRWNGFGESKINYFQAEPRAQARKVKDLSIFSFHENIEANDGLPYLKSGSIEPHILVSDGKKKMRDANKLDASLSLAGALLVKDQVPAGLLDATMTNLNQMLKKSVL